MIAENCIEPYDLSCDKDRPLHMRRDGEGSRHSQVRLATTCKAFAAGTKKGLSSGFSGKLQINHKNSARFVVDKLKKHKLDWVISGVTTIVVNHDWHEGWWKGVDFNLYPNTRILRLRLGTSSGIQGKDWLKQKNFDGYAISLALNCVKRDLVRTGRVRLLMDKLAADLRVEVEAYYFWFHGGGEVEEMKAILDVSKDIPVIVERERKIYG